MEGGIDRMGFRDWLQHSFNLLTYKEEEMPKVNVWEQGPASTYRPDRVKYRYGNEKSIINAIYTRIGLDVSAIDIRHVKLDDDGRFSEEIDSDLNNCLKLEANLDQNARQFIQDIVMSTCDEGVVAVVPIETNVNPETGAFKIKKMRVGKIMQWYPNSVQVRLYNENTGYKTDIIVAKKGCAIIENPFYTIMNEPNSTLKRLIAKLNILDSVDEQTGSGKLDIIIQLPYIVKTPQRRAQAEARRKDIEMQLAGSKYGIAYTDGTERITQLNRPAENNLLTQIEYLRAELFNQLGMTEEIFKGTADEATMLNYHNRTIIPFLEAICLEFRRKFISPTARTQGQSIMYFRDAFKLVPVSQIADISDKMTRNEILSPNEIRAAIGYKPDKNPESDQLRNRNINASETDAQKQEDAAAAGPSIANNVEDRELEELQSILRDV